MKHSRTKVFATVVLLGLVALGIPLSAQAQPNCSNATLSGSFGFTNTGTILAGPEAGPFGGVGRADIRWERQYGGNFYGQREWRHFSRDDQGYVCRK
jgi:hypothetical protein